MRRFKVKVVSIPTSESHTYFIWAQEAYAAMSTARRKYRLDRSWRAWAMDWLGGPITSAYEVNVAGETI